jgi:hypothetical protein
VDAMSWRESDFIESWSRLLPITPIIGFLVGAAPAALLDLATPVPPFVWVAVWIVVCLFIILFPIAAWYSLPYNRIDNDVLSLAIKDYHGLSKELRKLVPASSIEAIGNSDLQLQHRIIIAREVSALCADIRDSLALEQKSAVDNVLSDVHSTREAVAVRNQTYKEFM